MDRTIRQILSIMEDDQIGFGTTAIGHNQPESITFDSHDYQENDDSFSEKDLQLAKKFISIVGDAERARELIDKAIDCEECLGMVQDDGEAITNISMMMPTDIDIPMQLPGSSAYNPGM